MKPIIVNDHHDGWLSVLHVTDVRDGRIRVEGEKACTVCHVTLLSNKAEMLKSDEYGACYKANNHSLAPCETVKHWPQPAGISN